MLIKNLRFTRAFKRTLKKIEVKETSTIAIVREQPDLHEEFHMDIVNIAEPRFKDQAVQVYSTENHSTANIFICNRIRENEVCEAETQANLHFSSKLTLLGKCKTVTDKGCGTDICYTDKMVGPDPLDLNKSSLLQCDNGFHGFKSLEDDHDLLDLAGVNFNTFRLLLKIVGDFKETKLTKENRLLVFLLKMKLGITFSAIGVLFGIHRTSVSRIFYATLGLLSQACKNFIHWPSKETILATMPPVFEEMYPDCRVIIDCTEFPVEQPPEIDQRCFFYSHYKKRFTVKILVGCTPNGLISFVSQCFGGRTTDAQITIKSGLLNLLEKGDIILADKGFPEIKTTLDEKGNGVVIVMPPFLLDGKFSAQQVEETEKVASVRIHIERIMQRIKTFRITSNLLILELPYVNNIIFMACVLVNLQPPILRTKSPA